VHFLLLFFIGIMLAPDYASAQGCSNAEGAALYRNPNAWAAWCRGCGGRVVTTGSNPQCHGLGGGGGYVPPPDPLQMALPQWNELVRNAAPFVPNSQRFTQSSPNTFPALEQQLQSLFSALYYQEQTLSGTARQLRDEEARLEQRLRDIAGELGYLRRDISERQARAPGMLRETETWERQLREEQARVAKMQGEALYWENVARAHKNSVVRWFVVAAPSHLLKIERDALKYEPVRLVGSVRYPNPLPIAMAAPAAASPAPIAMAPPAAMSAAPQLQGDINERFRAVAAIPPRLQYLMRDMDAIRSRTYYKNQEISARSGDVQNLRSELSRLFDAEKALNQRRSAVTDGFSRAGAELAAAKESYAYRVSEALLWELAKEKVVKPGLRNFAREKMWFGNLDSLTDTQVDEMFEKGQKAWNGWFVWRGQENFFEVQDKTLGLIRQNESFLIEVPRIMATGSPGEIKAFAERVFGRLEANTSDIAKTALKDLTGFAPFDEISHKLAGFR
jgi:predicted nuclease with TOPRIM domain